MSNSIRDQLSALARDIAANTIKSDYSCWQKEDESPVTQIDLEVSRRLQEALPKIIPGEVLSEEFPLAFENAPAEYWLVDPIDGTREFVAGLPEFTINASFVRNGEAEISFIYSPAFDEFYFADGETHEIPHREPKKSLRVVTSHRNDPVQVAAEFSGMAVEVSQMGSSLKFGRLLQGDFDVFVRTHQSKAWDIVAGVHLLRRNGFYVMGMDGNAIQVSVDPKRLSPAFVAFREPWIGEFYHWRRP